MTNVDLFQVIAKELSAGKVDQALWTQATALADGEPNKTKAQYIKLRHAALEARLAAGPTTAAPTGRASASSLSLDPLPGASPQAGGGATSSADDRLQVLRAELRQLLALQGKHSLYGTIGCHPDTSMAALRAACASLLEKQRRERGNVSPEVLYAAETLCDEATREAYDNKLLGQLKAPTVPVGTRPAPASEPVYDDNASPGRMRQISMVLAGVGLLAFGILASVTWLSRGEQQIADRVVDTAQQAVQYAGDNDAGRVQNERILAEGQVGNQARAIEVVSELGNRSLDIADRQEDRQWRESDARINQMDAQNDLRRAELDERRRQAEWSREQVEQEREQRADAASREQLRISALNQSLAEKDFYTARQLARSNAEHDRVDYAERRHQAEQER